jgi:hypothetical protein
VGVPGLAVGLGLLVVVAVRIEAGVPVGVELVAGLEIGGGVIGTGLGRHRPGLGARHPGRGNGACRRRGAGPRRRNARRLVRVEGSLT